MPELNRRLTAEDASFLYVEKKEMPLHIGSVSIFDGILDFELFRETTDRKLHLIPRYLQRVLFPPFNIGHPTWELDPGFDVRNHIFHHVLPGDNSDEELSEFASAIFSPMMDRNKPLWDIYIVDMPKRGRSAMVARVHHCMVDGVSGVGLMGIILDTRPDTGLPPKVDRPAPPPLPDPSLQWVEGLTSSYLDVWKRMIDAQTGFLNLGQTLGTVQQATQSLPEMAKLMPELTAPLERYAINRPCVGNRKMVWSEHSFTEARQIRGALGGTVNDVVLTVLAGAMGRFLTGKGQNVAGKNLRVMVPVSLRKEDKKGALGNLVSALPALLPLDIADPLARFNIVRQRMDFMKSAHLADALSLMGSFAGAAPPMLQAFVGSLPFTSLAPPPFHMVCTNVPGPQIALYSCGREMMTYYPHVPPGNDLGVNMAIQSYNQKLFFGLTADRAAVPDPGTLRDFLIESFSELRKASGIEKTVDPEPVAKKPRARKAAAAKMESAAV